MSKKFECEMMLDTWGDMSLRVTHNGFQWSNIVVRNVDEAKKMIAVLQKYVQQQTTDSTNSN